MWSRTMAIYLSSSLLLCLWLMLFHGVESRFHPPFSPLLPKRCPSPPCVCDVDHQERKVVTCVASLQSIPINKMDPETRVINITSERYNSLTLGPIFSNLTILEEVHITRSKLPAIGESTFCSLQCLPSCQSQIRVLNLSQNSINVLVQKDFNCLPFLEILDLSDNYLSNLPSAPFMYLKNLRKLSLARNKLDKLVPLMFHSLDTLEELDLSENPLSLITSKDFKRLPKLRLLKLNGCQLTRLDGHAFSGMFDENSRHHAELTFSSTELSNLEYLDLSYNHLKHLNRTAFADLDYLKVLLLNVNPLTVLPDQVFAGLILELLDLSDNLINPLTNCVFCEALSIKKLDLSNNKLTSFSSDLFEPLANTLEQLTIDRNRHLIDAPSSLVALLQPLRRLRHLSASMIGLDESLPESTFDSFETISFLNISHNKMSELNSRLLNPLVSLNTLDVSHNKLTFIDPSTFQTFRNMKFLTKIYLHGNPYSCYRCQILPFIDWLNTDPAEYWNVCQKLTHDPERLKFCAKCALPPSLQGRYLHEPGLNHELEWCTNPEVQLRLTASEPQVGLILGFLIILSLLALILVVVAIYRKHGATYYTQEDKLTSKEEIYAASVAPQSFNWTSNPNRIVSLTSTNYTTSRNNTIVSPQSSTEQTNTMPNNAANYGTTAMVVTTAQTIVGGGDLQRNKFTTTTDMVGCNECANTTAVKQVIASIPAMTEILENSLQKINHHQSSNSNAVVGGKPQIPPPLPIKKSSITILKNGKNEQANNNGDDDDDDGSGNQKKKESTTKTVEKLTIMLPPIQISEDGDESADKQDSQKTFVDENEVQIYI